MNPTQTKKTISNRKVSVNKENNTYTSFVVVHKKYFPTQREILEQEKLNKPSGQKTINPDIFSQILNYQD